MSYVKKSVVIATGCDAKFFPYMEDALQSLFALNLHERADIGVLDLGLTAAQVEQREAAGCTVETPYWTLSVPQELQMPHQIGLVARTALPEYFPDYEVYLWFDADAWAQTDEFFDVLVAGARAKGLGITRENGAGYKMDFKSMKWWVGNMVTAYGLIKGLKVALKPAMNIGIMAIAANAPHWQAWLGYYQTFIKKRGRVNNQHSFNAAVEMDKLPYALESARCNWLPILGTPAWDPVRKLLVEPNAAAKPLSVIHLAGPDKARPYTMSQIGGGEIISAVTYKAVLGLQGKTATALPGENNTGNIPKIA